MFRIDIISAVPQLLESPLEHSIVRRAKDKGLVEVHIHNLHEYGLGKYRQVDDYAFGGGAGMVLMIEPLYNCITKLQSERDYDEVIYLSPDGELLEQKRCNQLSLKKNLIMICGHYKGIDQRVRDHLVTLEISIGDYVLTGGELAACVLADSIVRLIPGAIGDEESALNDSFQDGLLAPPLYTRPEDFKGWKVPDILLSGNHSKIEEWRLQQSIAHTKARRPHLLNDEHLES